VPEIGLSGKRLSLAGRGRFEFSASEGELMKKEWTKAGQLDAQQLLHHLAGLPPDAHEWVEFVTGTLRLPGSYAPAAHRVIGQNRWRQFLRKGQNVTAYVKTATMHEAMKMGLAMNRYRPDEPRVPTKEQPPKRGSAPPPDDEALRFDALDRRVGRVALPVREVGNVTYEDQLDHLQAQARARDPQPAQRHIPHWLRTPGGAINWGIVARHAVLNPQMAANVARVLRLRAQGWSRSRAVDTLPDTQAQALVAAWKWVDRYHDRIAHVLSLETPPVKSTPSTLHRHFIPPSHALLKKLSSGLQPKILRAGPSLNNARHQRWPGVPPDALVWWDGGTLSILYRGSVVTIKTHTIQEAGTRLGTLHATGELAGIFAFIENCGRRTNLAF